MKKMVVYSAIFSNKDIIREEQPKIKDLDYVMFTDNPKLESKIWDIRVVDRYIPECGARCSRYYKLLPHRHLPDYKYSLWIDGNITLKCNPLKAVRMVLPPGKTIAMPSPTNKRNCCYAEAKFCIKIDKDDPAILKKQIKAYRNEGMPKNFGLWGGLIIYRKHNDVSCVRLGEMWWEHFLRYSKRDQVSLPFVLWKNQDLRKNFNQIIGNKLRRKSINIKRHLHIWKRPKDKGSMP